MTSLKRRLWICSTCILWIACSVLAGIAFIQAAYGTAGVLFLSGMNWGYRTIRAVFPPVSGAERAAIRAIILRLSERS